MKTVLIIEDNENNMELISFILQANGYNTIKAFRGIEGIEKTRSNRPDLVLLDIQLPDIDGFEVLKRIRGDQQIFSTPIIAVTSYAMTGDGKKLLNAGCNGYIEKPIDPESIVSQIKRVIQDNTELQA